MENNVLTEALKYLTLGWSVIPLRPHSKEPLIKWTEFQNRRASESDVKSWFATGTAVNIGIVTGAISNLAIIDLDGPDGLTSGRNLGLKSSVVSLTGNGRQLWYLNPHSVVVTNAVRIVTGVDIRGEGGYVVAPPSIHPNGRTYKWLNPISALSVKALPPFPMHLIVNGAQSNGLELSTSKNAKGWIADALEGMTNGNIDNTLFKVCSRLRNDGYSEADARAILSPHAAKAGASDGHLDDKIRNVWGRYEAKNVLRNEPMRTQFNNAPLHLHSPSNPDSIDEFQSRMAGDKGETIRTGYSQFDTLTKGLKKGEVLTVAARTGVGKTNWVITPIRAFCRASRRVLLFSTEMSFDQIWQRYQATLNPGEEFREHKFVICDEFTPDIERIEEAIKNVKPDLFIFDHISHIGTDYHIISKFMSEIKRLARLYNVPAIVTAQLNRNADYVDQGARVEPRLSMIQGSDQIGQMSAQVLLLNEKRLVDGVTEIEGIVVKNRHGDKGMVSFGLKSKPHYEMVEL